MPRPLTPAEYAAFLGLSQEPDTEIGEQQASVLQNLYLWGEGKELVRRGGTSRITAPGIDATSAFDGLYYVRILGTDWLIAAQDGAFGNWIDGGRGDALPNSTGKYTAGRSVGAAFLPYALYLGDGLKQNVRWDGSTIKQVACSQPGSGTTAVASGSGSLTGVYTYKVTFTSADGHDSQASAQSANINASGNSQFNLTNIPTAPAGEDCTGRRLWRTINGGTDWYLVATISDNTTTTYTDTTADASVDTSLAVDASVVRFPPCQLLVGHQLRLCGILCAAAEGDTKTLYLSDYQKPWSCANVGPLDQVDDPTLGARIPLQDVPTGLIPYGNVLIVWFANQAWRVIGDNPNNWSFDKWLNIGCVSHRTAKVYRTALIWLAADGVYAVEGIGEGVTVNRISDDIRSTLDGFTAADLAAAHAFLWFDRYYLVFPTVSKAYYFDFKYRQWGELTNWLWDHCAVCQATTSQRERIFGTRHAIGQVWQLETGTTDSGETIPVQWRSKMVDMGQFGRQKRVHRIIVHWKVGSGIATVKLYRGGGELIQTLTHDLSIAARTSSTLTDLEENCVESARDDHFAIEMLHNAFSDDFRLLNAGVLWSLCT